MLKLKGDDRHQNIYFGTDGSSINHGRVCWEMGLGMGKNNLNFDAAQITNVILGHIGVLYQPYLIKNNVLKQSKGLNGYVDPEHQKNHKQDHDVLGLKHTLRKHAYSNI